MFSKVNHVAARLADASTGRRTARIRSSGRGVHLTSPTLLGHGGIRAARRLDVPTIVDIPNRRLEFRIELRNSDPDTGGVGMVPSSSQPCQPHPGAVNCDYGIPC